MLNETARVWIAFAAGGFLGCVVTVFLMCLLAMAGRTSRSTEEMESH